MGNSYFRFKQFTIQQDKCAMKVTTDACTFGAWVPVQPEVRSVLDIGAGTGLLSLMLAQRTATAKIDAIELDEQAAQQAEENMTASPWADRVALLRGDVKAYQFQSKYDLIISNPPFFNNSLLSDKQNKNMARHTGSLSYEELLVAIDANLADTGYAAVILPVDEYAIWYSLLKREQWHETAKLMIKHTPEAVVKRVVCVFSREHAEATEETLVIKNEEGSYTPGFTALLSPYYLDLQESR